MFSSPFATDGVLNNRPPLQVDERDYFQVLDAMGLEYSHCTLRLAGARCYTGKGLCALNLPRG